MKGTDIGVGWIDNNGKIYFQVLDSIIFMRNCFDVLQDRMAFDLAKPVIDNTTADWFALQGREENRMDIDSI